MEIKIKKLNKEAGLPRYAHLGDVGMDVFSIEDKKLLPGERHLFHLGFALEFEVGYAAIVKDKSSLAKAGVHTLGGVFDAGYRGEYNVLLVNLSKEEYEVEKGDKIAQILMVPVILANPVEVEELSDSLRGGGSFGSTGKK
ncbi:MAG: dUTP diphosphatase [Patescibacteria group bacterium]